MAFAMDWTLFAASAGDCRVYLFAQGDLRQLTRDHTVAAEPVRRGDHSADAAAGHGRLATPLKVRQARVTWNRGW